MNRADRLTNALLLALAVAAWSAVAYVLTTLDPRANTGVVVGGALLLGVAVAMTVAPVLWIAGFVRMHDIAYRGDWVRAGRRAVLCGLVVVLLVITSAQAVLSLPLAVFVIVMAVLIEATLSIGR